MDTFKYLQSINRELKNRYLEIEKMILYASSSFYDALGNLLESYLAYVALYNKIRIEIGASHGKITNTLRPLLTNFMSMDEKTFNQIKQISGNVNMHKHNRMRYVDCNTCLSNMHTFFDFYAVVSKYTIPTFQETFDIQYYKNLYGMMSSTNIIQLIKTFKEASINQKEDVQNLQVKIERYISLLN